MGCSASRPDFNQDNNHPPQSPAPSSSSTTTKSLFPSKTTTTRTTTRSLSAPLVHHFPLRKGDTHHLVSLTSTTYGSLSLVGCVPVNAGDGGGSGVDRDSCDCDDAAAADDDLRDLESPDSVINTWELMEGLDDELNADSRGSSDQNSKDLKGFGDTKKVPGLRNQLDCNGLDSVKKGSDLVLVKEILEEEEEEEKGYCDWDSKSKPLWKHLSEESLLSKMDPNVVSSYIRALSSRQLGYDRTRLGKSMESTPCRSFSTMSKSVCASPLASITKSTIMNSQLPGCEDKIVVYFTSLRGIRRTYEDCCAVRMIFRGFRIVVDERDISMDSMFRKELQGALGGKPMSLPQVFIRGKHIGGAEEIKQLHEVGELAKLLVGFPVQDHAVICDSCGNARFLPCTICNGSRKVFVEEEDRLRRCQDCNENGLIRCPACCS